MRIRIIGISIFLLFVASCKQLGTNPPDNSNIGSIKTGDKVDVATKSIGSGGGTVVVSATGKPVDGLTITIPPNSYSDSRTFAISYAPVTSHTFGEFFKPVSPLITISNGGGYGDSLMFVKIPVVLAAGELPFAFFYNDTKGTLEPIPMVAHDASSVTIMTRHFDVSGIAAGLIHSKFSPTAIPDLSKIIVSGMTDLMYNNLVGKLSSASSGFLPGVDDWEFENHGSYLPGARGGHCAGQDLSSLWYFFERKSKEGKLHHRFDQIDVAPKQIWEDNPIGYHVASAVQSKLNWNAYELDLYQGYLGSQDEWVWKDLILIMAISKEPMTMGIYGTYKGKRIGHNVTAYAVDIANKKIRIADPNYPGDLTREIVYNNGKFVPYFSGPTSAESDYSFDIIYLNGKTAVIDWTAIAQTWSDVVDNKHNPGYPAYSLWVNDGAGYPLTDGLKTDLDTLDFSPKWSSPGRIAFAVYDGSGNRIAPPAGANYTLVLRDTVILKPGENKFGIAVWGEDAGKFYFIDFQWIRVTYGTTDLKIDPQAMNGSKNTSYFWKALLATKPSSARYDWDFGDGTTKYVVINDTVGIHTYQSTGSYIIKLQVFDIHTNLKVSEATATAMIGEGFKIDSVTPDTVTLGMPITLIGSGFGATQGTSTVLIAGSTGVISSWSDTKIVTIVPDNPNGGLITVTVSVGGITSNLIFINPASPRITSLSRSQARPDEMLEIRGKYFGNKQGNATLYFRNESAPFTVVFWTDSLIRVIVPEMLDYNYGNGSIYLERKGWGGGQIAFIVNEDYLKTLQRTTYFTTALTGKHTFIDPKSGNVVNGVTTIDIYAHASGAELHSSWNGKTFTCTSNTSDGSGGTYVFSMNGTVNDSGTVVSNCHATIDWTATNGTTTWKSHHEMVLTNIPIKLSFASNPLVRFQIAGANVSSHVTSCISRTWLNDVIQSEYRSTDWTSNSPTPELTVDFGKR